LEVDVFVTRSGRIEKFKPELLEFKTNVYQLKGGGYEG
jgi:hypothetical protein